jgi:hypothetical protein
MGNEASFDWSRSFGARMVPVDLQRVRYEESNMRVINRVTMSVASLVVSAVAVAAEPSNAPHLPWEQQAARPVPTPGQYPALHWTSLIGTGSAAGNQQALRWQSIPSAASQPHARMYWSALVGTGEAAARERDSTH